MKSMPGTLVIELNEKEITMKIEGGKSNNWFLDLTTAGSAKLPFKNVSPSYVNCEFEGMKYAVKAARGSFSKPVDRIVFRITPRDNSVVLNFADIKPAE